MSEPLVWLPFDPTELGEPPSGLRYQVVTTFPGEELPGSIAEVEFFVPAYSFEADMSVMSRMPRLKVVQTLTAGVDYYRPHLPPGVLLCNGRGIHEASTAELALTLTLASLRGVPDHVRAQQRGEWRHAPREALADKRVAIVGYGSIGAAIEARLLPFEVEITRVASRARDGVVAIADLPALLPDLDVIILIVPLTEHTRGLVDADFLARLKPGALLVNVARGPVVDTDALLAALTSGRLHAALDVVEPEPLPAEHPLWAAPNLLISPHIGGASSAMWPRAYRLVREQLVRFAEGQELRNQMTSAY